MFSLLIALPFSFTTPTPLGVIYYKGNSNSTIIAN
jgi:hypothetical protein